MATKNATANVTPINPTDAPETPEERSRRFLMDGAKDQRVVCRTQAWKDADDYRTGAKLVKKLARKEREAYRAAEGITLDADFTVY